MYADSKGRIHRKHLDVCATRGFAFDPTGSGRWSIRGGYGIFYSKIREQANNQVSNNQPFSLKEVINNPPGGLVDPYSQLPGGNPFPFTPPSTADERANFQFLTPLVITEFDPNMRDALVQQWNFSAQRELVRNWILTVAYAGDKGNHLFITNELNPAIYGAPGGSTDARRALYPTFSTITDQTSIGNSIYHALQVGLNKRFVNGFSIMSNYTFGKAIDDGSNDGNKPADPFNIRNDRGLSNFNITHRFVTAFIWQAPRFATHSWAVRNVAGGWETSAIITLESGTPFSVTSGKDNSKSAVNNDRADLVGNPHLDTGRPTSQLLAEYFNTAAFVQNSPGTFGTAGRNILNGPGYADVDFGLDKNFRMPMTETSRLQFRAEMFNFLNRPNFGNPVSNISSGARGKIRSAGSPRVIQFALKFMF